MIYAFSPTSDKEMQNKLGEKATTNVTCFFSLIKKI